MDDVAFWLRLIGKREEVAVSGSGGNEKIIKEKI